MQLSVSAKSLKVKLIIPLIFKDQTRANPTKLLLAVPRSITLERTPKYPVAAIVTTEKRSVTILIHLEHIFWLTMQTT